GLAEKRNGSPVARERRESGEVRDGPGRIGLGELERAFHRSRQSDETAVFGDDDAPSSERSEDGEVARGVEIGVEGDDAETGVADLVLERSKRRLDVDLSGRLQLG